MSSIEDEAARMGISYEGSAKPVAPPPAPTPAPVADPVADVVQQNVVTPNASDEIKPLPVKPFVSETETSTAPVEGAAPVNTSFASSPHGRRRGVAAFAIVALALGGFFFVTNNNSAQMPQAIAPEAASVAVDPQTDSALVLTEELDRARQFHSETGTYRGFPVTAPIVGAGGNEILILSLAGNEGCFFTGLADGFDSTVKIDTTGENCAPGTVSSIQAELDEADTATNETNAQAVMPSLEGAVTVAQYWASTNYVNGAASFVGVDAYPLGDNVSVAAADATTAVLLSPVGDGTCMQAVVTLMDASYTQVSC